MHLNFKVCLPKETFQSDFHRKPKEVFFYKKRKKNPSIPGEHCLSVSSHTGFSFFKEKEEKKQRTTDFLMQTFQPFPLKASQSEPQSVTIRLDSRQGMWGNYEVIEGIDHSFHHICCPGENLRIQLKSTVYLFFFFAPSNMTRKKQPIRDSGRVHRAANDFPRLPRAPAASSNWTSRNHGAVRSRNHGGIYYYCYYWWNI